MDLDRLLQELREEREKIEEAMLVEELARRRRGRPPSDPPPTVPASQAFPRDWRIRKVAAISGKRTA
jgi:hypothetical protein